MKIILKSHKKSIEQYLKKDDMIIWYEDKNYTIVAPCYYDYKSIYKFIRKHLPFSFITNNMINTMGF